MSGRLEIALYVQGAVTLPDGCTFESVNGRLYEVVSPKWWRLDRWCAWWFTSPAHRGRIRIVSRESVNETRVREVAQ